MLLKQVRSQPAVKELVKEASLQRVTYIFELYVRTFIKLYKNQHLFKIVIMSFQKLTSFNLLLARSYRKIFHELVEPDFQFYDKKQ